MWNIHWVFIQLSDHVGYDKIQMHLYNAIVDFVSSSQVCCHECDTTSIVFFNKKWDSDSGHCEQ